jgi:hypothetical protein
MLGGGIIEVPRLAPTFIADEHHRLALVLELGQALVSLFDMGYAPKRMEVMYQRLDPMPYLIWCAPVDALSGRAVQDVDRRRHYLPQNSPDTSIALSMLLAKPMMV